MRNQIIAKLKSVTKPLLIFSLVFVLVFGSASQALAARSGGRIGGGSFRAPTRTYTSPRSSYNAPARGYGFGGGFGFPFLLPFFAFGGGFGGLFSILIFVAIANFLFRSFRNAGFGDGEGSVSVANPKVSVAKVQVGLLSGARDLQKELDELARTADTGTTTGRAALLQESTLALLRHPEYWVYGATEATQAPLETAEAKFNQLSLAERSKFTAETLSNVNSQLRQALENSLNKTDGEETSGEYIIVTLIVGAQGKLELPSINDSDNLRQALREIGGVGSDSLLAVEILWTPQEAGDTLSQDDVLAGYPNLKLV